jgi:hypothetical protein
MADQKWPGTQPSALDKTVVKRAVQGAFRLVLADQQPCGENLPKGQSKSGEVQFNERM